MGRAVAVAALLRMDFGQAVEVHATGARHALEHRVSPAARAFVRVAMPAVALAAAGAAAWAWTRGGGGLSIFLAAVAGLALLLSLLPLRTLRLEADAQGVAMSWGRTSRRMAARQVRAVAARRVLLPGRRRRGATVAWVLTLRGVPGEPDWDLGGAEGQEELLRVAERFGAVLQRPVEAEGFEPAPAGWRHREP
jgi:hypothetical protein